MNKLDFCKLLIQEGADINRKDKIGRTPLSTACYFDFVGISRVLLDNGAEIDEICMDQAYKGWDGHIQSDTLSLLREYGWINLYLGD